jgi:ABC-type dipeptide/oligopeptide/nickel transport system permease component
VNESWGGGRQPFTLRFGTSTEYDVPVVPLVAMRVARTALLAGTAFVLAW